MSQMRLTYPGISENAPITKDQHPAPVVPLERGHQMAVELIDPRCALEVVPRDLRLPCRDQWLVLAVVGVGCLNLGLAQRLLAAEVHLLDVLKGLARPLQIEEEVGDDLVQHPDAPLGVLEGAAF